MKTTKAVKAEAAAKLLQEIERARLALAIVEGKKDKEALERLGFKHIVTLEGKPHLPLKLERLKGKECVILTDFDKKGRELYAKLREQLNMNGIKINDRLRLALQRAQLSHIEGLASFLCV